MDYNDYNQTPAAKQNNTLGIIGLVTGILALLFFCCPILGVILAVVALVCGIIAKGQNQKFALAGIIMGIIALLLSIGVLAVGSIIDWEEILRNIEQMQ
jgi:membrane-bound ClpP family serine protease